MSKDKPKSPFADVGDDTDWDKALDAWEMGGDNKVGPSPQTANVAPKSGEKPKPSAAAPPPAAPPPAAPAPAAAPPAPAAAKSTARASGKPLYNPRSTDSLSVHPPPHRPSEKRAGDSKDGQDERSAAGAPAQATDRTSGPPRQGTGLGQALRTDVRTEPVKIKSQPLELAVEFSETSPSDGLIDALLERRDSRPVVLSSRPDEPSVVTSAPKVDVQRVTIPEAERRAMRHDNADAVAEDGLYDPFAEQRAGEPVDDRKPTVRPGPALEAGAPTGDAGSAVTPRLPPQDNDTAARQAPAIPGPPRAAGIPRPGATPEKPPVRAHLPKLSVMDERADVEEEPTVIKASPLLRVSGPPSAPGRPQGGLPSGMRGPAAGQTAAGLPGAHPGRPAPTRPTAAELPKGVGGPVSAPGGPTTTRSPSIRPSGGRPLPGRSASADEGRPSAPRPSATGPGRIPSPPPQAIRLDRLPLDSLDEIDHGQEALFEQMERSFGPSDLDTPGMRIAARRPGHQGPAGSGPMPLKPPAQAGNTLPMPGHSPHAGAQHGSSALASPLPGGTAQPNPLSGNSPKAALVHGAAAQPNPLPSGAAQPSLQPGGAAQPNAGHVGGLPASAPPTTGRHGGTLPGSPAPASRTMPKPAPSVAPTSAGLSGFGEPSFRAARAGGNGPSAPTGMGDGSPPLTSASGTEAESDTAPNDAPNAETQQPTGRWLSAAKRASTTASTSGDRSSSPELSIAATPSGSFAIEDSGSLDEQSTGEPADSAPSVSIEVAPTTAGTERELDEGGPSVIEVTELEAWRDRAAWLEAEANADGDRAGRARGLLIASELWAMAGNVAHAEDLAAQSRDMAPGCLAHRQARTWAIQHSRWAEVLDGLQAEFRTASSPPTRAHAAHFAAEIARIALKDDDLAGKKIEQANRAWPVDARAYVWRIAEALTHDAPLPKLRFPEGAELQAVSDALARLQVWRGEAPSTSEDPGPVEALLGARAALSGGDLGTLAKCLEVLGSSSGLREPAMWLMVVISLARPEERDRAASLLNALTSGPSGTLAYRALAALAIDRGDTDAALQVLGEAPDGTFDQATKVAIAALASAAPQSLGETLQTLERDDDFRTLALGARAAIGSSLESGDDVANAPPDHESANGSPPLRLGRLLGGSAPADQLASALVLPEQDRAQQLLSWVLEIELDLEAGRVQAVAEKLAAAPPGEAAGDEQSRDRALVAALLHEVTRDTSAARRLYESARKLDPGFEAAARAQMVCSDSLERPALLLEQEAATTDVAQAALLIVEAALSGTDPDTYAELLRSAHRKAPAIPFSAWLSERRARARGEFETMVSWLRDRREVTGDAVEAAHDRVREALLIADEDPSLARQLLEQATNARPDDLAMRELYERLSPEQAPDWVTYWTAQATQETGLDRARTELMLALEYERTNEYDLAAKAAREAVAAHDDEFARLTLDRMESRGPRVPDLTERLLTQIRASESAIERIELYQRLAALDEAGQSGESSVPWYQAILEEHPGHLPSLCKLEHMFISDGRDEDLIPVATEIAKVGPPAEAMAHAEIAARFMARTVAWQSTRPIIDVAFERPECSLWALREMEAHSIFSDDSQRLVAASRRLAERTIRPLEVATLSLRAAEASVRLGDFSTARELLERVVELDPTNLVAQGAMADLCLRTDDANRAAEAKETLAEHCAVPAHQTAAWYEAALVWLDRVGDIARGRAALEHVAEVDLTYKDTFERLQAVYVAASDRESLAELLEKRLALANTPEEKVELEIVRGRTLADLGDRGAAKRALAFALEQSPDHVAALAAFADVCGREEDWPGAEQAYIRLVRLIPEPQDQAEIYKKLGEIYSRHQPNLERAELAYNEVLRRLPADTHAQEQLVDICERAGLRDRAIELQQKLLHEASGPDMKRRRTVELALVHERTGDARKAENILEAARKEFPNDVEVLGALAEFHKRAGKPAVVQLLLDRAAGDARRALSTGRFDVNLFSVLAAVAGLRDRAAAAHIAEASVAALEGRSHDLEGAGVQPLDPSIDDLLAPEVLSPALRTLLAKSGEMLDAASPVDLRALRAGPLTEPTMVDQIRDLAEPFGFESLEVFVSPALGAVCLPIGSCPPQVVIGAPLLALPPDDRARAFIVARTLKIVQARASALARSAPIELLPLVSAYLKALAPEWQPVGIDQAKLQDLQNRMQQARSQTLDDDVGLLALEVTNSLGNRMSTLNTLVYNWGNRLALLWFGDLAIAFQAIARAAGHAAGPAPGGPERLTWIGRSAEARDLAIFSVSDAYAEARHRVGT